MTALATNRRIYVDSSVWIALLAQESTANALNQWLEQEPGTLMTSQWTRTELASAMGIKARRLELTQDHVHRLLHEFEKWVQGGVQLLSVDSQDFVDAAGWCAQVTSKLRGADALHLAVARRHQVTHVATLDHDMASNATRLGLNILENHDQ